MQVVDLGDPQSIEQYRNGILADLPDMFGRLGFVEQARSLEAGDFGSFVTWYTTKVAIEGHGATDNAIGLTVEQTRLFNPMAIKHRLMGPVELWKPGDAIPADAGVGEIKQYDAFPELHQLIPDAYKARRGFVIGALFRGIVGRATASLELAEANELIGQGVTYDLVALTGMRAAQLGDLGGDEYRTYFADATGDKQHDLALLRDEANMFHAIYSQLCDLEPEPFMVVEDMRGTNRPSNTIHPDLGARDWIIKRYHGTLKGQPHKPITLTIVNGEAYAPEKDDMNRSAWGPKASRVLADWLEFAGQDPSETAVYNISYAHMLRIAAALYKEGRSLDGRVGKVIPVGNMPMRSTWYQVNNNGYQNGGTLGFKEVIPVVVNINGLLGRPPYDLSA